MEGWNFLILSFSRSRLKRNAATKPAIDNGSPYAWSILHLCEQRDQVQRGRKSPPTPENRCGYECNDDRLSGGIAPEYTERNEPNDGVFILRPMTLSYALLKPDSASSASSSFKHQIYERRVSNRGTANTR